MLNGVTRPFFGWVSDHIGRENTMFIAFLLEAVGILALATSAVNPVAFVVLTGMVFFAWGEIYSLFPATCGDTFGRRSRPPTPACSTPPRARRRCWCRSSVLREATGGWHGGLLRRRAR